MRYQYRIGGDECFDDYCLPVLMGGAAYCALSLSGSCICCLPVVIGFYSYFVAVIMKILQESEVQLRARGGVPGFYLSSPPGSLTNDNRTVFPSTAVYVNNDRVTDPVNAAYVPVASTVELGNHAGGGGGPGQFSHVPTAAAAEESSNAVTKNYV